MEPGLETLLPLPTRGLLGEAHARGKCMNLRTNPGADMGRPRGRSDPYRCRRGTSRSSSTRHEPSRLREERCDWPYEGGMAASRARRSRAARGVDEYKVVGPRDAVVAAADERGAAVTDAPAAASGASSLSARYTADAPDVITTDEDLSDSPLWNPDLAPTPLARRTWSTYNIAALWIGMSVVITTYTLASGLMTQGMNCGRRC